MARLTNSSSKATQSRNIRPAARAKAPAAQEKGLEIEHCVQALAPSQSLNVSSVGDCNLECSYCAVRWSARRVQYLLDE